jgi:subtilisin family serine protease
MKRLLALTGLALAVLALGAERTIEVEEAQGASGVQVVVALESPPLAYAPGGAARIAGEQRAFRQELARRLPDARVRWRYRLVQNGFAVVVPASQVARLRMLPGVREVYDSARYEPQLDTTPQAIGATALWGAGLETAGQGVKIGIIDTGVDHQHPFFDPTGYTMPTGFPKGQVRFTNAKVIVARAFAPPRVRYPRASVPVDGENSSHGTHVAGIAAGNPRTEASSGRRVSGIAPRAYLGNYKALVGTDSGLSPNGNAPELVAAIEAAVRDGMDVINLSIGEPEIEPRRDVVALALDAAARAGVVPVVAAGNDFNDLGAGSISSPANSAAAISVAAFELSGTSGTGTHADFSSVGPTTMSLRLKPDVAAPGVGVLSAVPQGWSSQSGTSMASPHVAGAAALLVQRHPAWTPAQVKSALVQTATDGRGGNGALGPELQGGGVVTLGKADNPLLFADPTGISFGLLAGRGGATEGSVQLRDAGGGAGPWDVSVQARRTTRGVSLALASAQVTVPGQLAYVIRVGSAPRAGDFSGYLVLRRGADIRRIPFWGRYTEQRLGRHRVALLRGAGTYRGTTAGKPAHVSRYRYPDDPRGVGLTTVLRGPEAVYRVRLPRRVANLGVVITSQRGRIEPRVVTGLDENRLTGYAGLPLHHNPYLEGFRSTVPAAAALSPLPGDYFVVFDSAARAGAGRFTFRLWINDVTPPALRLRSPTVRAGSPLRIGATDGGSGVYPQSIRAAIDGDGVSTSFRDGVIRIPTGGLAPGRHRVRIRVSDYQETKNTENVARILPNTRTFSATFTVR